MNIKKVFIGFTITLFFHAVTAQEIDPAELAKMRENPDMSHANTTTRDVEQGINQASAEPNIESSQKIKKGEMYEDPNNPGIFIALPDEPINDEVDLNSDEIIRGGIKSEALPESALNQNSKVVTYSSDDLDIHALRIAANCAALNTEGQQGAAVIPLDDSLFVIPVKSGDLPPLPSETASKRDIHGIDVNKNCVRDDVEHHIFKMFSNKNQANLRKHLYTHAIWLNFFLIKSSDQSIQAISRQNLKTTLCLNKLMTIPTAKKARIEIFALMHNTDARTVRYFEHEEKLTNWKVDADVASGC